MRSGTGGIPSDAFECGSGSFARGAAGSRRKCRRFARAFGLRPIQFLSRRRGRDGGLPRLSGTTGRGGNSAVGLPMPLPPKTAYAAVLLTKGTSKWFVPLRKDRDPLRHYTASPTSLPKNIFYRRRLNDPQRTVRRRRGVLPPGGVPGCAPRRLRRRGSQGRGTTGTGAHAPTLDGNTRPPSRPAEPRLNVEAL